MIALDRGGQVKMSLEKTFGGVDPHIDQATDFEPKGSTFFLGKADAEYAERPFMELVLPGNGSLKIYGF